MSGVVVVLGHVLASGRGRIEGSAPALEIRWDSVDLSESCRQSQEIVCCCEKRGDGWGEVEFMRGLPAFLQPRLSLVLYLGLSILLAP